MLVWFFFFKQRTAYEMRIGDWSSDVCSSDLAGSGQGERQQADANATVCLRRPSTGTAPLRQLGCYDHRATRTAPYLAECSVHQRSPVGISTAINGRPWFQIANAAMPSQHTWQSAYAQKHPDTPGGAITPP